MECLGLASPLPISGASVAPLCVSPRLPVIHAGVLVRVLLIVARVSITCSLGELFASDSDEKGVSGGTEGRDREKSGRKERRVAQVFALVSTFWVDAIALTRLINATPDERLGSPSFWFCMSVCHLEPLLKSLVYWLKKTEKGGG